MYIDETVMPRKTRSVIVGKHQPTIMEHWKSEYNKLMYIITISGQIINEIVAYEMALYMEIRRRSNLE